MYVEITDIIIYYYVEWIQKSYYYTFFCSTIENFEYPIKKTWILNTFIKPYTLFVDKWFLERANPTPWFKIQINIFPPIFNTYRYKWAYRRCPMKKNIIYHTHFLDQMVLPYNRKIYCRLPKYNFLGKKYSVFNTFMFYVHYMITWYFVDSKMIQKVNFLYWSLLY